MDFPTEIWLNIRVIVRRATFIVEVLHVLPSIASPRTPPSIPMLSAAFGHNTNNSGTLSGVMGGFGGTSFLPSHMPVGGLVPSTVAAISAQNMNANANSGGNAVNLGSLNSQNLGNLGMFFAFLFSMFFMRVCLSSIFLAFFNAFFIQCG